MARRTLVWLCALPLACGCATEHDAGAALVATGAVVALAAADAATGRPTCTVQGCTAATSRHAGAAAAGVAAGVALAAAGAAMERGAPDDAAARVGPDPGPPRDGWRLIRHPDGEARTEDPDAR